MGLGRLLRAATAMAVVWGVVAAPLAAGSESRRFNPGYAMSKQYVAVTAYKVLRDHALSTVEGCERNVKDEPDRFDDLSAAGEFTRGSINCLDKLGYLQGLPGGSGSSFEPGYAMSKQYVAVTVYKILRDHAPDSVEGCERNVKDEPDRFDDLSAAGAFTRGSINCLDKLGFLEGLPGGSSTDKGAQSPGTGTTPSTYKAVAAGGRHSCAIAADDTITCWGNNYSGQADAPNGKYKTVTTGNSHSCAIAADDTITCWGANRGILRGYGQTDAPDGKYKTVTAGSSHSCAIAFDDTITCWGAEAGVFPMNYGQADPPDGKYKTVTAGPFHSCAIAADDTITCWGAEAGSFFDNYGQADPPDGKYKTVTAGDRHSCAITFGDTITCWGAEAGRGFFDNYGQADPPGGKYKTVTAGANHSCAIAADDTITCWGNNEDGQTDAPGGKYKTVTAGGSHSCAIATDNTITCWGNNDHGQADAPGRN